MRSHTKVLAFAPLLFLITEILGTTDVVTPSHRALLFFLNNAFFASACLGALLVFFASRPKVAELGATGIIGIPLELWLHHFRAKGSGLFGIIQLIGPGLLAGAVLARSARMAVSFVKKDAESRALREHFEILATMIVIPTFIVFSDFFLGLTVLLHPGVLDTNVLAAEAAFGIDRGFSLARYINQHLWLAWTIVIVYVELPLALGIVYIAERRKVDARHDALWSFLWIGIFGFICYHLCPVIGPRPFVDSWPNPAPALDTFKLGVAYHVKHELRNCIPSLHTSWALMLYWHARWVKGPIRIFGALFLFFTLLATVGLGQHYVMDLVIAFPFAMAVRAGTIAVAWKNAAKQQAFFFGIVVTGIWLALIAARPQLLAEHPLLVRLFCIASVTGAWALEKKVSEVLHSESAESQAKPVQEVTKVSGETVLLVCAFVFSGFAGLVYEVVFAKELALTFGSTAKASTTVLSTYMGGLALGSYIGARIVAKRPGNALRLYVLAEVGVASLCAFSPFLFPRLKGLYVALAHGSDPGMPSLTVLQILLGSLVLLPPTICMGMTMPALAAYLDGRKKSLGESIAILYGANTLGAAAGAVGTGYYLLPTFGITRSTWLAVGANVLAACVALVLARLFRATVTETREEESAPPRWAAIRPLVVLGIGGLVTLALETTYIHLLAVVAGNSAYAFSLMLFAFLLGLGVGSSAGRAWLRAGLPARVGVIVFQSTIAATVLVGVFLWGAIPSYFGGFYDYTFTDTFAAREVVRFLVCAVLLVPVACAIGASYPVTMQWLAEHEPTRRMRIMGRGMAVNTAGNIAGALVGSFLLMPLIGSLRTLHVLSALSIALAFVAIWEASIERTWRLHKLEFMAIGPAVLLLAIQPASLDWTELSKGANVYFYAQAWGRVFDHAESADGGLTAVAESFRQDKKRVQTLLTNGKFQGDDDPDGEMRAQLGFALVPMVHTENRGRALVIGLGTGVSSRTIRDSGFQHIEVAELSRDIATLAHNHFGHVNGKVLDSPIVKLLVTDGRNHLMLADTPYDLISIEISSIWFAGAASLYNREFYELVQKKLAPTGVFQQWMQLHRISKKDVGSILGTLRSVFPHTWFYFVGRQGIIVSCKHDCRPTQAAVNKLNSTPELKQALDFFDGKAEEILESRLLDTEAMDAFIKNADAPISTDDNLFLEYSTPRGNVRPYNESLEENEGYLREFQPEDSRRSTALPPK